MKSLVCKFKGHLWQATSAGLPIGKPGGTYIAHRRCFRCGRYEKTERRAVSLSPPKELN